MVSLIIKVVYKNMHIVKKKINLLFCVFFVFIIILSIIIQNNCNFSRLLNVFIDYNYSYAYYSCKKLTNYNLKKLIKKKVSNTHLEKILRRINKKQIKNSYTFLKKNNEIVPEKNTKNIIPQKIHGIKNNIDQLLKEKKIDNNGEIVTWKRSHGGYKNLKYNRSSNPINIKNIKNLSLEWSYSSIGTEVNQKLDNVEANPIYYNGKIFSVTADKKLIALNAITGDLLWKKQGLLTPARRGFLLNQEKDESFIYLNIGEAIAKIDSNNGNLDKKFGINGILYSVKSITPPIVYKNKLYIVSSTKIIVFDKNSGKFIENIQVHPKNKEFSRGAVIWGGNAFDEEKGFLYVVTGNPRPALIGIDRVGENKNANSLIAIDLNKSKIIWTFQDVFHDLWDFDISSPPIITDLKIKNKYFEAVIISTKSGNTYIFERNLGKSFFDLDFKKVLSSNIPGERAFPYQRKNLLPEKLINIEYNEKSFNKLKEDKQKYIKNILKNSSTGWFVPPEIGKKLIIFGLHGGATWMGSAYDPVKQVIFTPVVKIPWVLKVEGKTLDSFVPSNLKKLNKIYLKKCSSCHGKYRNGNFDPESKKNVEILKDYIPSLIGHSLSLDNNFFNELYNLDQIKEIHKNLDINDIELKKIKELFTKLDNYQQENEEIFLRYYWYKFLDQENYPASNPPWGEIIALDLLSGKIKWKTESGEIKNYNENILSGKPSYGGLSLTSGEILFSTGTDDNKVYAINSNNGKILWDYKMDAAGSAPPLLYNVNGKQYLTIISSGGLFSEYKKKASKIYTFSIKN